MKIYKIAKELGLPSTTVIELLNNLGHETLQGHLSIVDEELYLKILKNFTSDRNMPIDNVKPEEPKEFVIPGAHFDNMNTAFSKGGLYNKGLLDIDDRLSRVDELLAEEDHISSDLAAMILCATLENCLRLMTEINSVPLVFLESEGIRNIASSLEEAHIISPDVYNEIIDIYRDTRVALMHGEFQVSTNEAVRNQLVFIRKLFATYWIINHF